MRQSQKPDGLGRASRIDDPADALRLAGAWLAGEQVVNSLLLSLLDERARRGGIATTWIAREGADIAGVAIWTGETYSVNLSRMPPRAAAALAEAFTAMR